MKLKFRADPKDLVIFSIFCLVLLYLSAIAVVNLHEFANYGSFAGYVFEFIICWDDYVFLTYP